MYTVQDFKTKKALKEAVEAGRSLRIYQPGGLFKPPEAQLNYTGRACLEGPHYPALHTWYASAELVNGIIVKVK